MEKENKKKDIFVGYLKTMEVTFRSTFESEEVTEILKVVSNLTAEELIKFFEVMLERCKTIPKVMDFKSIKMDVFREKKEDHPCKYCDGEGELYVIHKKTLEQTLVLCGCLNAPPRDFQAKITDLDQGDYAALYAMDCPESNEYWKYSKEAYNKSKGNTFHLNKKHFDQKHQRYWDKALEQKQ